MVDGPIGSECHSWAGLRTKLLTNPVGTDAAIEGLMSHATIVSLLVANLAARRSEMYAAVDDDVLWAAWPARKAELEAEEEALQIALEAAFFNEGGSL